MGISNYKFFVGPIVLAALLFLSACSSEPRVLDASKDNEPAEGNYELESKDALEPNKGSGVPSSPEMSEMVNDPSDDGAIAAAEFFIEAYEYAYRAADDSPLQRIFDEECDFCEEISGNFEEFDRRCHHAPDINFHDVEFMHTTDHEGDLYVIHRANIYNLSIIDKDKNIINEIEDDYY